MDPAYGEQVQQLESKAETRSQGRKLRKFFTALGVLDKPAAGSPELQHAISCGDRWFPLLQLLADHWANYSKQEQMQLVQQLCNMQVVTSCGTSTLSKCFLQPADNATLLKLLPELGVPLLDVPEPQKARWSFLEQCGVSRSLSWQSLHKVLQQLRDAEANPPLESMRELYALVEGVCMIAPQDADKVVAAFSKQRLIYLPVAESSEPARRLWWTSADMLWSGNPKMFPKTTFLKWLYKDQEAFFHQRLHVRKAELDDMKEALLEFSQSPEVTEAVIEATRLIYTALADSASQQPISWLSDLVTKRPVLLVQGGSNCRFTSASNKVFVPDNMRLVQLFSGDCSMLHVAPEAVPVLQPLLQCIQPQLPQLSTSVKRTYEAAAAGGTARQRNTRLTELVRSALPFAARCLYHLQPSRYQQLLRDGTLKQLWDIVVDSMPGLLETLELDGIQKQQPAIAAVQVGSQPIRIALIVDTVNITGSCVNARLLQHMADRCAEVLSDSSSSNNNGVLSGKLCTLLQALQEGDSNVAEAILQDWGMSQIPAESRFWSIPGDNSTKNSRSAAQAGLFDESAAKPAWEEDNDQHNINMLISPIASHREHLKEIAASVDLGTSSLNHQAIIAEAQDAEPVSYDAAVSAAAGIDAVDGRCDLEDAGPDSDSWSLAGHKQHQGSRRRGGGSSGSTYRQQSWSHQAGGRSQAAAGSWSAADNQTVEDMLGGSVPGQDLQRGIEQVRAVAAVFSKAVEVGLRIAPTWQELFSGLGTGDHASTTLSATVRGGSTAVWNDLIEATKGAESTLATTDATRSNASSFTATRQVTNTFSTTVTDTLFVTSAEAAALSSSGTSGPPDSVSGQLAQVTGVLGECFLFDVFKETLPNFDEHCWKSGNRTHAGLAAHDSEPPFDFLYEDVAGKLTGVPGTKCVIECKATSGSAVVNGQLYGQLCPIPITAREWHLAQMLHHEKSAVYVIVRVEFVKQEQLGMLPRIAAVLVDPVRLMHEGSSGPNLMISGQELQLMGAPLSIGSA